jgi:hypothetical protein
VWGKGDFWDLFDCELDEDYHAFLRYVRYVRPEMLSASGNTVITEGGVERD